MNKTIVYNQFVQPITQPTTQYPKSSLEVTSTRIRHMNIKDVVVDKKCVP